MAIGKKALDGLSGPSEKSLDNIRRISGGEGEGGRTGRDATKKGMAQSPNSAKAGADNTLALGTARELIRTAEGRKQLAEMVRELSPRAQTNFFISVARETRDPQAPRPAGTKAGNSGPIALTPEGQAILDIAFQRELSPETVQYLNNSIPATRAEGDPARSVDLDGIPLGEDASPKAPPAAPKVEGKFREPSRKPSFRSTEKAVERKDGGISIQHSDVHLDRKTNAAIEKAKRGEPVTPISDDDALAASRSPRQYYTQMLNRVAELRDPNDIGQLNRGNFTIATVNPADYSDLVSLAKARGIKNPNEFSSPEEFARALVAGADQEPYNVTPITASQRAEATGMVADLADNPEDITGAAAGRTVRTYMPAEAKAASAAERALVQEQVIASIAKKADSVFGHHGWGENYKPATASAGVDGPSTEGPSTTGTTQDPHSVPAIQEFGPDWESISVNQRGTPDVDSRPYEERVTSYEQEKDRALRRIMQGDENSGTGYFDPNQPLVAIPTPPRKPVQSGKPGSTFDPELTEDDLVDMHNKKTFAEGDPNATGVGGEEESVVTTGRAQGDKAKNTPSKAREEGGHKTGAYEDEADFSEYNRENRNVSDSDLNARKNFYDHWKNAVDLEVGRSSEIRKEIRALVDGAGDEGLTPEQSDQLASLQQKLRLAERLDAMSGIKSSRVQTKNDPETGLILRPGDNPADLDGGKLAAAEVEIEPPADAAEPRAKVYHQDPNTGEWVESEPFDYDGAPRRDPQARIEHHERQGMDDYADVDEPDTPNPKPVEAPVTADTPPPKKGGWRSRAAKVGAGVAAGLGVYNLLQQSGQPPVADFDYYDGGQGGPAGATVPGGGRGMSPEAMGIAPNGSIGPATSEDRIRSLQNFLLNTRINPNTQTMQNWIR